jgi:hypothetical protein
VMVRFLCAAPLLEQSSLCSAFDCDCFFIVFSTFDVVLPIFEISRSRSVGEYLYLESKSSH